MLQRVRQTAEWLLGAGSSGGRPANAPAAPLDLPPRSRRDLFFRVLLAPLSDQRDDRPARHSSRPGVPGRRRKLLSRRAAFLVRAHPALVWLREPRPDADLLARPDRFRCRHLEPVAARRIWRSAWFVFSLSSRRRRIFPASSPTACCWKRALSLCSSRRPACAPAWEQRMRLRGSACFSCAGNGSASTLSPAWSSC